MWMTASKSRHKQDDVSHKSENRCVRLWWCAWSSCFLLATLRTIFWLVLLCSKRVGFFELYGLAKIHWTFMERQLKRSLETYKSHWQWRRKNLRQKYLPSSYPDHLDQLFRLCVGSFFLMFYELFFGSMWYLRGPPVERWPCMECSHLIWTLLRCLSLAPNLELHIKTYPGEEEEKNEFFRRLRETICRA